MNVYFVRHGETEANKQHILQGPAGGLSEHGRKQAAFVAKRFDTITVDLIVSSPIERTKETTEIINSQLNKEILYSELFVEWLPPSRFRGVSSDDPTFLAYLKEAKLKRQQDPTWQESDGDSFLGFKTRAVEALDYLISLKKENILVVTHAGFLRMLASVMMFGKELTYHEYGKVFQTLRVHNTAITLCDYLGDNPENPRIHGWKIRTWNDHAHLGEIS